MSALCKHCGLPAERHILYRDRPAGTQLRSLQAADFGDMPGAWEFLYCEPRTDPIDVDLSDEAIAEALKAEPKEAEQPVDTAEWDEYDTVFVETNFAFGHLPVGNLRETSIEAHDLANKWLMQLPANNQRTKALEKLLEAKDCAVRANLEGQP